MDRICRVWWQKDPMTPSSGSIGSLARQSLQSVVALSGSSMTQGLYAITPFAFLPSASLRIH
eukprot:4290582-Amphidinium_carterae.1